MTWSRGGALLGLGLAGLLATAVGATIAAPRVEDASPLPLPPRPVEPAAPLATPLPIPDEPAPPPIENEPDLPPAPAPMPEPPRWIRHVVVPGDSISRIALRYGVAPADLRAWNELPDPAVLKPRQRLRVWARKFPPPRRRVEHVVGTGDTWGSLARAYGVSSTELRATNVAHTGRRLDEGERVSLWIDPPVYEAVQGSAAEPGPTADIYPGGHSIGTPNDGTLVNGARLPESPDYELRYPNSAWGTTFAVRQVVGALRRFREQSGFSGRLVVGTMSRERGGDVGGHRSHQSGRDVDIRLPVRAGVPPGLPPRMRTIDWEATWHLVDALADVGGVQVIFLEYRAQRYLRRAAEKLGIPGPEIDRLLQWPRGSAVGRALVRHSPGHDTHLHARFACATWETECADG